MKKKQHLKKILPFLLLLVTLIVALPFLTSCSMDGASIDGVNGSEIVNLVFPNPIVFAAQVVATIILFIAVTKFVWKPYNEMLQKRKQYVLGEIKEIEAKKKDIFAQEEATKQSYLEVQQRTSQMLIDAKQQSETIISESKVEAKNKYDNTIKEAQEEITRMKLKMQIEMASENVNLVMSAAEQLTMKNINSEDNKKFVEDFLNKIDKEL